MSEKYLGKQFDIHGGGMDLAATHHTNEIAQSQACYHVSPVRYWIHTNMLTVNGVRMSKSAGNGFLPEELFSGSHPLLDKAYSPMNVRFFMLQTHYRSTLDFSNEALQAAEKGLKRLWEAYETLQELEYSPSKMVFVEKEKTAITIKVENLTDEFDEFMNDDFNTAKVLANMFELVPIINSLKDKILGMSAIEEGTFFKLKKYFKVYLEDIFGLKAVNEADNTKLQGVMQLLIDIRKEAKGKKDFVTSDKIRNQLTALGITLKDEKDGGMSYSFD
jgi:cysteinyl-tRNA synthetase